MQKEMENNAGPSGSQIGSTRKRAKAAEAHLQKKKKVFQPTASDTVICKEETAEIKIENHEDEGDTCYDDFEEVESEDEEWCSEDEEDLEDEEDTDTENDARSSRSGVSSSSSTFDQNSTPLPNTSLSWSSNPPSSRPNFPFRGQSGLLKDPKGNQPHDFFNLLFTEEFLQFLVQQTNIRAQRAIAGQNVKTTCRIVHWKNTSIPEMKVFLGLIFHMGIIKLNRLVDYWNKDQKFGLNYFRNKMSRNRWTLLHRNLRMSNDVVDQTGPKDPSYKIKPLVDFFHRNMQETQGVPKNLCVHESMPLWTGRVSFRQLIQKKRYTNGIKLYMLTEPDGPIHRLLIYTGSANKEVGGPGHAKKVVFKLMSGLLGEGRSIYVDDFHASVNLAAKLLDQRTYITGPISSSKKNLPGDLNDIKLKKDELVQRWSRTGINVTKWRYQTDVLTVSTEFSGDLVNISLRRVDARKPQSVLQYNKNMRGVGRVEQHLSCYLLSRKTLSWHKKLTFYIFELLLYNSYILYRRNSGTRRIGLYEFRLEIIDYLCGSDPRPPSPVVVKGGNFINLTHFPWDTEVLEGKSRRKQCRCRFCSSMQIRTQTTTYCPGCPDQPALCRGDCFLNYHQSKGFAFI